MLRFDPIAQAGQNWVEHGWGDGVAMSVATSITRAHQIVLAQVNAALARFGLTFSRFEVLALLHFARANALPMGKIGDRLQVHPTSVTSLVNRLVDDEMVVRTPHPTDRRTMLAELTDIGRTTVVEAAAALEAVEFGVSGLGDRERHQLNEILTSLRREAQDWTAT